MALDTVSTNRVSAAARTRWTVAERLTKCKGCGSVDVETVTLLNPDTRDMNCDAVLRCNSCQLVFNGRVGSPYYHEQRVRGWII
jgi:hypothetical protein